MSAPHRVKVTHKKTGNPHENARLAKVVVNIGVGDAGEKLAKAEKVLAALAGQKPVRTLAKTAVRDWAVRRGQPIGVKVTLRKKRALDFLAKALDVRSRRVAEWAFDAQGNVSFGLADHTDFPGQKYDPDTGVFGMDVSVVLEKPGFRVKHRRVRATKVPHRHRVTRAEAKEYMKANFKVEVVE